MIQPFLAGRDIDLVTITANGNLLQSICIEQNNDVGSEIIRGCEVGPPDPPIEPGAVPAMHEVAQHIIAESLSTRFISFSF